MKAILVIDKPSSCIKCRYSSLGGSYCKLTKEEDLIVKDGDISENCPLKPMPRKRGKITLTERTQDIDHLKWQLECNVYSEGYNKCIDEILGEEE